MALMNLDQIGDMGEPMAMPANPSPSYRAAAAEIALAELAQQRASQPQPAMSPAGGPMPQQQAIQGVSQQGPPQSPIMSRQEWARRLYPQHANSPRLPRVLINEMEQAYKSYVDLEDVRQRAAVNQGELGVRQQMMSQRQAAGGTQQRLPGNVLGLIAILVAGGKWDELNPDRQKMLLDLAERSNPLPGGKGATTLEGYITGKLIAGEKISDDDTAVQLWKKRFEKTTGQRLGNNPENELKRKIMDQAEAEGENPLATLGRINAAGRTQKTEKPVSMVDGKQVAQKLLGYTGGEGGLIDEIKKNPVTGWTKLYDYAQRTAPWMSPEERKALMQGVYDLRPTREKIAKDYSDGKFGSTHGFFGWLKAQPKQAKGEAFRRLTEIEQIAEQLGIVDEGADDPSHDDDVDEVSGEEEGVIPPDVDLGDYEEEE